MKTELIRKFDIIGLAIIIGIFLSVATIFFYQKESKNLEQQKNSLLTSIGKFKTKQMAYWYQREINNTMAISNSFLLKSQLSWYIDYNQPEDAFKLRQYINQIKSNQNCHTVSLFSIEAGLIASTHEAFYKPDSAVIQAVHFAGSNRIATSTDFYQSATEPKTYIDFIAPLTYNGVLLGFISCSYEAENTIYPILNEWPVPSKTGQTQIITVSDEGEINLNSIFPGDTFKYSNPLSNDKLPQRKIIRGYAGIVTGMEHNGRRVVAFVNEVPDTPWYLCATIAEEEIYAELNNYVWLKLVSFLAFVLVTALSFIYLFNHRQQNIYKALYLKEKEIWQQKEQFLVTIDSLGEGVITLDTDAKIQYMNKVAEQNTGWDLRDARGRYLSEVYNVKNETTGEKENNILEKILNQGIVKGLSNHTILIAKDGSEIPVEDTGAPVYDPHGSLTGISIVFRDETEKRAHERLIIDSEERLRQVTENLNDVFWLRDSSNNSVLYVNPAYEKVWGRSCQTLYDDPDSFLEIVHESDRKRVYEEFESYKGEGMFDLEYRIVRPGNDIRWVHIQTFPIKNDDGITIRHAGKVTDITARKDALDALRKSEEHYRVLVENMGEGVLLTDTDDVILFVNRKACNIYGYEPNELIGKYGYEILEHESYRSMVQEKTKHRQEKISDTYEVLGLRKNGEKIWIKINGAPIYNTEGNVIGSVGILSDITEQKLINDYIKANEKKLNEAQVLAQTGSWEIDLITGIAFWSDNLYNILELEPGSIEPSFESLLQIIHPEDKVKLETAYQEHLRTGKQLDVEVRCIVKNGDVKYYKDRCQTFYDNEGKPIRSMGTLTDITERVLMENDLIKAREKAEESDRLKSAFLANVSHEIRTPMNGIIGFLNLIKEQNLSKVKQEQYFEIIKKSSNRLLHTINDLVEISLIESGQSTVSMGETDTTELLQYLLEFFRPEAEAKGLTLNLTETLSSEESVVKTDNFKLESILANLIKNAIKYTVEGHIDFGCTRINDAEISFYVKDTGIGIPSHMLNQIFDRFVQVNIEASSPYEGAGLGLSIVKGYIEILNGSIRVESVENEGSKFIVQIKSEPSAEKEFKTSDENNTSNATFQGKHILVIDDEETNITLFKEILSTHHCKITVATNGAYAIKASQSAPKPDLILMDIRMPGINGLEATRKIRQFDSDIPIIAQSAYAYPSDIEEALKAGCNDYITKPIDMQKLIGVMNSILNKKPKD